jgi:hypothetical protein
MTNSNNKLALILNAVITSLPPIGANTHAAYVRAICAVLGERALQQQNTVKQLFKI